MAGRKDAKREWRRVLELHESRLDRVIERGSVRRLRSLYDQAEADVVRRAARLAGPLRETFSAHANRSVLAQLRVGQAHIARTMAGELGDMSREAQVASLRGLNEDLDSMERAYKGSSVVLPTEEAARFWGVVGGRRSLLRDMHERSMSNYAATTIAKMEEGLAVTLATGGTAHDAIGAVEEAADANFYQAERIVRTELSAAYNMTHADGIAEAAEVVPDMMMRWTEYCSDSIPPQPLDDRVAADSIAMHGQVTEPGGYFTMPDDDGVPDALQGQSWQTPPNRPNDRSRLVPWRAEWGIMGWEYRDGDRFYLT